MQTLVRILNVLVLGMDCLSFVFLTPQLAGEQQLQRMEFVIDKLINIFPKDSRQRTTTITLGTSFGIMLAIQNFIFGPAHRSLVAILCIGLIITAIASLKEIEEKVNTLLLFLTLFFLTFLMSNFFIFPNIPYEGFKEGFSLSSELSSFALSSIFFTFFLTGIPVLLDRIMSETVKWVRKATENNQTIAQRWAQVGITLFLVSRAVSLIALGLETQVE